MKKEIKISFSYVKNEFLVRLFGEDGLLYDWFVVSDTKDIQKIIQDFYFKQ